MVDLLLERVWLLARRTCSAIKGASFALRELRHRGAEPLRVFYAFDPARDAVLIIGGTKKGDDRFYERMIREAEKIWTRYLAEHRERAE